MNFSDKLEHLAARCKGFVSSPNLNIKLLPGNEFIVTAKFEIGIANNHFHKSTSLKGYYFKTTPNTTQVNLLVTPHSMLPLLFLLLPVFFMVILFAGFSENQKFPGIYIAVILGMVATPVILLLLSAFSKKRLLDRFVKCMGLSKIN